MIRRFFCILLAIALCCAPVTAAMAEDALIIEETDPEVQPAEWIGAEGLTAEDGELPDTRDEPAPRDGEPAAEAVEGAASAYGTILRDNTRVVPLDGDAPVAVLSRGSVVLVVAQTDGYACIAFNCQNGVFTGRVEAEALGMLDASRVNALMNEVAEGGLVVLYENDIDRPLVTLECGFIRGDAGESAGAEDAEPLDGNPDPDAVEEDAEPLDGNLDAGAAEVNEETDAAETERGPIEGDEGEAPAQPDDPMTGIDPEQSEWESDGQAVGALPAEEDGTAVETEQVEAAMEVAAQPGPVSATDFELEAASLSLGLKERRVALAVTLIPQNSVGSITWRSSKPSVVTVDANTGAIKCVKKGSARIYANMGGIEKSCKITVKAAPGKISLDSKSIAMSVGDVRAVRATLPKKTASTVTFNSDNPAVASVDANGAITALSAGTAKITAETFNHKKATVKVQAFEGGPAAVALSTRSATIGLKQKLSLNPVLLNADGTPFGDGPYTVSSNSKKLKVDGKGVVKALGRGTFTVTVTAYNGVSAACEIKVVKAPTKVSISPRKPTVGLGQTLRLDVSISKGSATTYRFSSSNKDVVAVDEAGNITGVSEGKATVKVKTHNGKTAKATVTVTRGPGYLSLNGDYELVFDPLTNEYSAIYKKTLSPGGTFQIAFENEYNTNGSISGYGTSNPEVATVSDGGIITAVAPGTAIITVRSTSGAEARMLVTVSGTPAPKIGFSVSGLTVSTGRTASVPSLVGSGVDAGTLLGAVFSSSDPTVFGVTWSEGEARWLITGIKPGEALLTASVSGMTAQLPVKVVDVQPAEIHFSDNVVYMAKGESYAPVVLDEYDGVVAATLSCENAAVVSLDGSGRLVALGEGSSAVTATYGSLTAGMTVNVISGGIEVSLDRSAVTLGVGEHVALKARVNGGGTAAGLTYSSSDPGVATVNTNGRVIARAVGSATITASVDGATPAACSVVVGPAPTVVSIEPASVSARLGEAGVQLAWSFGAPDQVGAVSFDSADPEIASVSADGYVTYKSAGRTQISVEAYNGVRASIEVTVLPKKAVSDAPVYRLFAAYSYFSESYDGYIPFTKNNATSVADVFGKSSIGGLTYRTRVIGNPSKTQLLSGISGFFADAGDKDVSIVYLCSHGHMVNGYGGYRMSLPGYSGNPENRNYYLSSQEIMNCVANISGSVVLILDSCYSGAFLQDMKGRLDAQKGRIAVLTAASDTRATYYKIKDTSRAVDFFTFFLLKGLGYNSRDNWWNADAKGSKGKYPGHLGADAAGNGDGIVTLRELFDFASKSISANIPNYMKKSWYWGDKTRVQAPRIYAGNLSNLVVYQPD